MENEIWKKVPLPEYKKYYSVSNLGRIRNNRSGHILPGVVNPKGYRICCLSINGDQKQMRVHRLVAMAFKQNRKNKETVNHLDGNKLNNRWDNLQWATNKENCHHAHRTGLITLGKDVNRPRLLSEDKVRAIKRLHRINPKFKQTKLAKKLNVPRYAIVDLLRGVSYAWVA